MFAKSKIFLMTVQSLIKFNIDHDKILNHLIHMENRVTNVLKNLRDKKRNLQ